MLGVFAIPAFEDNYFWLLQPDALSRAAYIIDPGAAEPVLEALTAHGLSLAGVIITHHHHDHIDGIEQLVQRFPVPVYGPDSPRIPQITITLRDGDLLELPGLSLEVLAVPGHTLDHIAYLHRPALHHSPLHHSASLNSTSYPSFPSSPTQSSSEPASTINSRTTLPQEPTRLFCGDTLFAGGCGRLFDGTASHLYDSLMRLCQLDDDTLVYCAHEYTLINLQFACVVEPDNQVLVERLRLVQQQRKKGLITLPTNIGLEKATNPFLRTHQLQIKKKVEQQSGRQLAGPREVFTALRQWKDRF